MTEISEITRYDLAGYNSITAALTELLNQYPDLSDNAEITFSSVGESSGIAFYPTSGAVILDEKTSITGQVWQKCNYPFTILYRTNAPTEKRRIAIKQWLDNLGCWLECQPIVINNKSFMLTEYPILADGRKITSISRTTPSYLDAVSEGAVEDWLILLVAEYENYFKTKYANKIGDINNEA